MMTSPARHLAALTVTAAAAQRSDKVYYSVRRVRFMIRGVLVQTWKFSSAVSSKVSVVH